MSFFDDKKNYRYIAAKEENFVCDFDKSKHFLSAIKVLSPLLLGDRKFNFARNMSVKNKYLILGFASDFWSLSSTVI